MTKWRKLSRRERIKVYKRAYKMWRQSNGYYSGMCMVIKDACFKLSIKGVDLDYIACQDSNSPYASITRAIHWPEFESYNPSTGPDDHHVFWFDNNEERTRILKRLSKGLKKEDKWYSRYLPTQHT